MRYRRYPTWIRRVATGIILPFLLICVDAHKFAFASRQDRAQKQRLLDIAKKQNLDPEMLLDPAAYQKHEADRAKVRRAKAVAEAEALSRPDPAKLKAAQDERDSVKRAYAPVELASIAKDIEGLRTTLKELDNSNGNRKRRESALRSIDGYARILSDAHEVLARYDAAERTRLATLPAVIRARHDKFMRATTPVVNALRTSLVNLTNLDSTKTDAALMRVRNDFAHIAPAPTKIASPDHGFALKPAHFTPVAPRMDPAQIQKIAPNVMTPAQFDQMQQMLRKPTGFGGIRGVFKVPAFLTALLTGPGSTDLNPTDEAPRSDDIVAEAHALNNDPIQIYNFVHDTIVTEVYYGSKKGARGTLMEHAGNDFDQASLLIALLRAAGYPARWEIGTVNLTPQQAMDFTGTETPAAAASALVSSGFPAQQLASGNMITAVQLELAWVRAFVPYADYRGAAVSNAGGSIWAHLAPSIKRYQSTGNAIDLRNRVPFDFGSYLSREQSKSPADTWEDSIRTYTQANPALNCTTLDSAQKIRLPIADRLPLLPETLPGTVVQRLAVFSNVPSAFKHTVRILGKSSGGNVEADYNASIAAIYGRPLAVIFEAATEGDQATLTAHGGLANTPPFLVQLRPTLYSADEPLAIGTVGDTPGENQSWQVVVTVPNLSTEQPLQHLFSVGGVYAIILDPGTMPGGQVDLAQQLEQQFRAAGMPADFITSARLAQLGRRYFADFDRARDRINGQYWSRYFKDTYEASFGVAVRGQTQNGTPVTVKQDLVDIDVTRLTTTPFSIDGNNIYGPAITRLVGHQSSFLEHSTPQAFFGPNQWSAVRLLQNAAQSGQMIFRIDTTNIASVLPRIALPPAVAADLEDEIARGRIATIHSSAITPPRLPSQWGYIVEDPNTGEGAFRINADLNGGDGEGGTDAPAGPEGCACCAGRCPTVGSNFDVANGVYFFDDLDMSSPVPGGVVEFRRSYRSSNASRTTSLGPGWQHGYDERIEQSAGSVVYYDEHGKSITFSTLADGTFATPPGYHQSLAQAADGSFAMTFKDGTVHRFDVAGRLTSLVDSDGRATQMERDGNGRLVTVRDSISRPVLSLSYDALGHLVTVTDVSNRSITLEYDTAGRLVGQVDVLGQSKSYGYEVQNRLMSKTDYRGNVWAVGYDDQGRWRSTTNPSGGTKTAQYDSTNRITVLVDELQRPTTYTYDERGALITEVDAEGNSTYSETDQDFNRTREVGPRGETTSTTYDALGNMLSRTDALGNTRTLQYGSGSTLTALTDEDGVTITARYSASNHLLSMTDGNGNQTTYSYQAGLPITLSRPGGSVTSIAYDFLGNISSITDPAGGTWAYVYDTAGRLTSVTDPNGVTSARTFDAKGRVKTATDPTGGISSYDYDADGNLLSLTDALGHRQTMEYDAQARQTTVVNAAGQATRTEYDAAGQVIGRTDPNGATTRLGYDPLGRIVRVTSPNGAETTTGYCSAGTTPCRRVDPLGNITSIETDLLGREVAHYDADGNVARTTYSRTGRKAEVQNARGLSTHYVFDNAGRPVEFVDKAGGLTAFQYDARGNKIASIDPNGRTTQFVYDNADRLTQVVDPLSATTSFSYDSAGNMTSRTDSNNHTTKYSFDGSRRIQAIDYDDGNRDSFEHDAIGHLTSASNRSGSATKTYDSLGRILSVTDRQLNKTVSYSYDNAGNRSATSISDGASISYLWDEAHNVKQLRDSNGATIDFAYDVAGRRTVASYSSGVSARYQYDANSRVTSIVWFDRAGLVIDSFAYTYDILGNRTSRTRTDGTTETYGYDALSRITSVSYDNERSAAFLYDSAGNRIRSTEVEQGATRTANYEYNERNQLKSLVNSEGVTNYSYDAIGNLTQKLDASGTTRFTYDARNLLTRVASPANEVSYDYDAEGRRIAISDSNGDRRLLLDGEEELAQYDSSTGDRLNLYERDPSRVDLVFRDVTPDGTSDLIVDALGSPTATVNASGQLTSRVAYDVFGQQTLVEGVRATRVGFTGQMWDAFQSTLGYFRARYYDPAIGRFVASDPAGSIDGPNTYTYARNNPATWTDPSGMYTNYFGVTAGIFAIAMGVQATILEGAGLIALTAAALSSTILILAASLAVLLLIELCANLLRLADLEREAEGEVESLGDAFTVVAAMWFATAAIGFCTATLGRNNPPPLGGGVGAAPILDAVDATPQQLLQRATAAMKDIPPAERAQKMVEYLDDIQAKFAPSWNYTTSVLPDGSRLFTAGGLTEKGFATNSLLINPSGEGFRGTVAVIRGTLGLVNGGTKVFP
jgi:RHS repeat-associated protein